MTEIFIRENCLLIALARLHCADEDSKALMSVFSNMHGMRGVEPSDFMKKLEKMKKVYLKSVIIPKNSKEIKEIANHLNPGSKYVLLPSIFGVYNIFVSSPLFKIIEQPENFKFEVSGYCVSHGKSGSRQQPGYLLFPPREGEISAETLQCEVRGGIQGEDQDRPRLSHRQRLLHADKVESFLLS